jgi:hypothetical protein
MTDSIKSFYYVDHKTWCFLRTYKCVSRFSSYLRVSDENHAIVSLTLHQKEKKMAGGAIPCVKLRAPDP